MQKEFEAMAKSIMDRAKDKMGYWKHDPTMRLGALQQMKAELFELKACYEGLVQLPTETFDTYMALT